MDDIWYYTDKLQSLSDLFDGKPVGDFIVRPSLTVPDAFTLVVKDQLYLLQIRIVTNTDGDFSLELPSSAITRSLKLYAPLEVHSKCLHSFLCKLKQYFKRQVPPKALGVNLFCVQLNKPIRIRMLTLKHSCRIAILKLNLNYSTLPASLQMYLNDYRQVNNEW